MNLIEARNNAKMGNHIRHGVVDVHVYVVLKPDDGEEFRSWTALLPLNVFFSDQWEIVKSRKKLIFQNDDDFVFMHKTISFPTDAKITVEWEE